MDNKAVFAPLLSRLRLTTDLDDTDGEAISRLPLHLKRLPPDAVIVSDGDRPSACCLLIDGFILRSKIGEKGARQILSIHQPGDLPDLQSLYLHVLDHDVTTLNECLVGFIPHPALRKLVREQPNIAEALWRDTLVDAAIFREWIVNVGQRPAESRLAHLLLEIYTRLTLIGRAKEGRFHLPITQVQLAEATGLSNIHINRMMQKLRADGLLTSHGGEFVFLNEAKLREISQFDPRYLHTRPAD